MNSKNSEQTRDGQRFLSSFPLHKKNRLSVFHRQPFLKVAGAGFLIAAIMLTQVPVPTLDAAESDFRMDGTTLVKYSGSDTNVTIPGTVTSISAEAFADNKTMSLVTIPDSVKKIEMGAFSGCTDLKAVTIPDSVTEIGKSAFSGCTDVTALSIGRGLDTLGASAFGGCTSLKEAAISENNPAFYCTGGVIYDRGQTTVYQMLAGRQGAEYSMPSTVTKISEYAFWNCGNLKKVSLSNNLTEIPAYAFSNCNGLESVSVPYSVKSIQMKAFENCKKLSDIDIPESVSFVHETAFDGCPLVKDKIKTTPLVTADTNKADTSDSGSTDAVSDNTANNTTGTNKGNDTNKATGTNKGNNTNKATDTNEGNNTNNTTGTNEENGNTDNAASDDAESESVSAQQEDLTNDSADDGSSFSGNDQSENTETSAQSQSDGISGTNGTNKIDGMETKENPEVMGKTKIIGGQALVLIDAKHANVISDGVSSKSVRNENDTSEDGTRLVKGAYYRNAQLSAYPIDKNITTIEDFAFARSGLKGIQIPDSVTNIGYAAFYHCDQLANITIPDSVTEIGAEAFQKTPWMENWLNEGTGNTENSGNTKGIENIENSGNTKGIENSENIKRSENKESGMDVSETYGKNNENSDFLVVGDGILIAYRGTSSKVVLPENVKQIASGTFKNHTEIQSITFPDALIRICDNAFDGCEKLESFEGGNNLRIIDEKAFENCPITLETTISSTTVPSSRQNAIGNVGNYQILRKSVEKDPALHFIKISAISVCALLGSLCIALCAKQRIQARKAVHT